MNGGGMADGRAAPSRESARAGRIAAVADAATAASVALLATNALRPGASMLGAALLTVWAVIPRIVSAFLEAPALAFKKGGRFSPSELIIAGAIAICMSVGVLSLGVIPGVAPTAGFETTLLAMCWVVGFALRSDGVYAIWEPLVLGTALFSLTRGPAHAIELVAVAFLSVCLSGAVRRQLAASTDRKTGRRVDLKRARTLAAVAAALMIAAFLAGHAGLSQVLHPRPFQSEPPNPWQRPPAGGPDDRDSGGGGAGGAAGSGGSSGTAEPSLRRNEVAPGLSAESEALLRVTAGGGEAPPRRRTLWKSRSYARFDPATQGWRDEEKPDWQPLEDPRAVLFAIPPLGGPPTTWKIEVLGPRFEQIPLPYFADEVRFGTGHSAGHPQANATGDLRWARRRSGRNPGYQVLVRDFAAITPETAAELETAAGSAAETEVPAPERVGVDLRKIARETAGGPDDPLARRLARLRSWFATEFLYAPPGTQRPLADGLGELMTTNRRGSCQHFASAAALLLRATGAPTRFVTGYAGAEPVRETVGIWVVTGGSAHAWIEILTESGWLPLNPSAWVPADPESASAGLDRPGGAPSDEERRSWKKPERPDEKELPDWLLPVLIAASAVVLLLAALASRKKTDRRREPEEPDAEDREPDPIPPGFVPRTPAEHLLVDYGRLQSDLIPVGQERRLHETPREHARRVSPADRPQPQKAFASLVPLIDDGLYGKADLTDADLARGRRDLSDIKRALER
jgi:hypothetical protein